MCSVPHICYPEKEKKTLSIESPDQCLGPSQQGEKCDRVIENALGLQLKAYLCSAGYYSHFKNQEESLCVYNGRRAGRGTQSILRHKILCITHG